MKRRDRCGCGCECRWEWGGSEGKKKESLHTTSDVCRRPSGHFPGAPRGKKDKDEYRDTEAGKFQGATF